jgi:hypothetical protein
MIGPNGLPHPGGHPRQGDTPADIGAGSNLSRRDGDRDPRRDADPQKGDRFGKALQKALAAQRTRPDDDPQPTALAFAPPLSVVPQAMPLPDAPPPSAPMAQHSQTIADRIDRYLRSAEAQSGLRDGQSMLIRLPTGPMGLSHVTVTMRDGVLQIALSMQAALTGAESQLALLGQAIAQRQPKLAFHLSLLDEDEDRPDPTEPFNPLMPQRKPG